MRDIFCPTIRQRVQFPHSVPLPHLKMRTKKKNKCASPLLCYILHRKSIQGGAEPQPAERTASASCSRRTRETAAKNATSHLNL